jgi:hypothetical protein
MSAPSPLPYPCHEHEASINSLETKIAVLESKMERLTGNGQPGWIADTNKRLNNHDRLIWLGMGALGVLDILRSMGLLDFLRVVNK